MSQQQDAPTIMVDQSTIDAIVNQVVANINKKVVLPHVNDHAIMELKEVKRQIDKSKADKRIMLQSKGNQSRFQNQSEIEDTIDESLAEPTNSTKSQKP